MWIQLHGSRTAHFRCKLSRLHRQIKRHTSIHQQNNCFPCWNDPGDSYMISGPVYRYWTGCAKSMEGIFGCVFFPRAVTLVGLLTAVLSTYVAQVYQAMICYIIIFKNNLKLSGLSSRLIAHYMLGQKIYMCQVRNAVTTLLTLKLILRKQVRACVEEIRAYRNRHGIALGVEQQWNTHSLGHAPFQVLFPVSIQDPRES